MIGSAVGERVASAAKGREDGIKGRGGRGMDEAAQWKQVDEYMVKGGFFDTVKLTDIADMVGIWKQEPIVAAACEAVLEAKSGGSTYEAQKRQINEWSKEGGLFETGDDVAIQRMRDISGEPPNKVKLVVVAC